MSFFTTSVVGSIWQRSTEIVPASSSKVVMSVPTTFKAMAMYVNGYTATQTRVDHFLINLESSGPKWTRSNKIGNGIRYSTAFTETSGNLEMTITNSETFDISIELIRVQMGNI